MSLFAWMRRRFFPQDDWREEMEAHLEMRKAWNRDHGMADLLADSEARKKFGSQTRAFENVRDVYWARWIDDGVQDLRHAVREWRRHPSLFLTILATLGLGIGAATAIFSLVDPLLFRPLPYPHGERLVSLGLTGPIDTHEFVMGGIYLSWRDGQTSFAALTSMRPSGECDVTTNRAMRVPCVLVESNFLRTLEIRPEAGRDFTKTEDTPGAPLTAILSHSFAQGFGGAAAVGRVIDVDGGKARVIGILPPKFLMPQADEADVLLPAQLNETAMKAPENTTFLRAFARLKPDVTINRAREQMIPVFRGALQTVPPSIRSEIGFMLRSLRDRQIEEAKAASWMLLLAVLFLLAMSSVNVTNLLLARSEARREEFAMRRALGASHWRLLRQAFTESLLYGAVGAALGMGCAVLLLRGLAAMAAGGFLRLDKAHVDWRVMIFTVAISLFCALIVGSIPTLHLLRPELLRTWTHATARRSRLRQLLLSLQIAFSLLLLSGSLLFMRSLVNLESATPGFSAENLVAVAVNVTHARYPKPQQLAAFHNEFERRLSLMPATQSFALSDSLPPAGGMHGRPLANIVVDGTHEPLRDGGMVAFRYVTPEYFKTMRIPILSGRVFSEEQRVGKESFIVLSESLARRIFGRDNPLGRRIALGGPGSDWYTIIGVVGDVKNLWLDKNPWPEYYKLRMRSANQLGYGVNAIFRTSASAATVERWTQKQIAAIDPTVPLQVVALPERLRSLNDRPRFLALIMTTLALAAVLLAAVGLYGVVSFLAASRKRELGLRAALGASRKNLIAVIEKDVLPWVLAGTALGIGGELLTQRYIRSLLFDVSAADVKILASAVALMLLIAVLACWRPAVHASKVDPAITLRVE